MVQLADTWHRCVYTHPCAHVQAHVRTHLHAPTSALMSTRTFMCTSGHAAAHLSVRMPTQVEESDPVPALSYADVGKTVEVVGDKVDEVINY